ncbi:MAG TPA: hypothetical protein PKX46_09155, partial [Clostridia bacterium]|nr:hypothetical protein [Clostridia bacterium]
FRLASDDKIKNMFPIAILDSSKKNYTLKVIGRKEKPFYIEPGAIISNRPISEGFLGVQYNRLGKIGFSAYNLSGSRYCDCLNAFNGGCSGVYSSSEYRAGNSCEHGQIYYYDFLCCIFPAIFN